MSTVNKFLLKLEDSKYDGKVQVSEAGVEQVAEKLYLDVLEGRTSAINMVEMFKFVDEVGSAVKAKADINGKYKFVDLVRDEIKRNSENGKSCTSKYGTKLELAETGAKYDYSACGDPEWNDINKRFKEVEKERKDRETFLKTIGDKGLSIINEVVDEETGEVISKVVKLYPAIKTSTSSFKQTLLKD